MISILKINVFQSPVSCPNAEASFVGSMIFYSLKYPKMCAMEPTCIDDSFRLAL